MMPSLMPEPMPLRLSYNLLESKLDDVTEMKRLHLQVIEIEDHADNGDDDDDDDDDDDGEEEERFLLVATEAGLPVDVDLVAMQVAELHEDEPITFVDVTADTTTVPVKTGILEVRIENLDDADVFEFRVEHDHGGGVTHFGTAVVSDDALFSGQ